MQIYKVFSGEDFAAFEAVQAWDGAAIDRRDGYIHFSTAAQVGETLARHFGAAEGLRLAAFAAEAFGSALTWEPSRGGDLFPHLYAPLPKAAALRVWTLARDDAGAWRLPEDFTP